MTIHLYQKFLDDGALQLSVFFHKVFCHKKRPFGSMTILKAKITIFGFNFGVFKISFWVKQRLLLKTNRHFGQVESTDVSDVADVFFSNFYKSDFSIFACSQIRKVGCLKSEIFKCPSCRYLPIVKYENLDFKNPRFTNIRLFDVCL